MIFTSQQLAPFALGISDWHCIDNAFHANRIPPQMRPIHQGAESATIRMHCPAGVRLRFETDSTHLRIGFRYGPCARKKFRATVLVDDAVHSHPGATVESSEWKGTIFEQPARQCHTFDLWLPPCALARVMFIETVDDRELSHPAPLKLRWLVLGDSITQGMDCDTAITNYVARCALELHAEVHNLAIGGAILDPRLSQTLPEGHYDVVSIAYGTNDIARGIPAATFAQRMESLIDALAVAYPKVPVIVITNPPVPGRTEPDANGQSIADFRIAIRPLHHPPRVFVLDGGKLVPNDPRWFVDNVHPNDEGFALYARALLPVLREALASAEVAT